MVHLQSSAATGKSCICAGLWNPPGAKRKAGIPSQKNSEPFALYSFPPGLSAASCITVTLPYLTLNMWSMVDPGFPPESSDDMMLGAVDSHAGEG